MFVKNGIAYAGNEADIIEIETAKPLDDLMMILTFSTGEVRLYDVSPLLKYPAFASLSDPKIFNAVEVDGGIVTWCNGEMDIAPETMYRDSYPYISDAM